MYNQVSFKKKTLVQTGSLKSTSISGGVYHKNYASSVYSGTGVLGTNTSSTSHNIMVTGGYVQYSGIQSMRNEKETMQILNERLASYMDQVRSLENSSAKLEGQIREWYSKNSKIYERDDKHYFQTIEELGKQIQDATVQNASIFLQIDNTRLAADDFKAKLENEQVVRLTVEKDIYELRKVIDEFTITNANLEDQIESLNDKMIFRQKNHIEEIDDLRKQATGTINVEVVIAPPVDLGKIMEEMRAQYEQLVQKQRLEAKHVFEKKVEEWNIEVQTNESEFEKYDKELKECIHKAQALKIESESELSKKNVSLAMLENITAQYTIKLAVVQENINNIEALIKKTHQDVDQHTFQFTILLSIRNRLEAEIATYRSLLDGGASSIPK